MKRIIIPLFTAMLTMSACHNPDNTSVTQSTTMTSKGYKAKNKTNDLTCKLTAPELQARKETVLKNLKEQVIVKKELADGYAFKFPGTDKVLDQLSEFIKTERACCQFFVFGLSISGDKNEIWLELTGPVGVKDIITTELEI